MLALPPDVALLFARQQMADDQRKAVRRRRVAEATPRTNGPRGLLARLPFAGDPPLRNAQIRIADADPSQHDAMLTFLGRLSPHTPYSRYVTSAPTAHVVDVHLMLANDGCHRAVLALRGEEIVGHAQAVASPDGGTVELGVVIADEWQATGIGPRLVRALLETGPAARAADLEFFVLNWNGPARRLVKELWPEAAPSCDGELIHYRVHTCTAPHGSVRPGTPAPVPAGAEDQRRTSPEKLTQTNDKDVRPCSP